jgi:dihydroxyacetone kinase-like protein
MERECLDTPSWIEIFGKMADDIEAARDRLNELDGVIGDGDHGVTMSIGFRAVREALGTLAPDTPVEQVFARVGAVFMNAAGGAIGPLIGTMWTDSAKNLAGCRCFGAQECKTMLETMEKAIVRRGKASPGDKTLLDALHPAVQAGVEAQSQGLSAMLRVAAEAAGNGARATSAMVSRVGRSRRLGEQTLGHEDAGANSIVIILSTIAEAVANPAQANIGPS